MVFKFNQSRTLSGDGGSLLEAAIARAVVAQQGNTGHDLEDVTSLSDAGLVMRYGMSNEILNASFSNHGAPFLRRASLGAASRAHGLTVYKMAEDSALKSIDDLEKNTDPAQRFLGTIEALTGSKWSERVREHLKYKADDWEPAVMQALEKCKDEGIIQKLGELSKNEDRKGAFSSDAYEAASLLKRALQLFYEESDSQEQQQQQQGGDDSQQDGEQQQEGSGGRNDQQDQDQSDGSGDGNSDASGDQQDPQDDKPSPQARAEKSLREYEDDLATGDFERAREADGFLDADEDYTVAPRRQLQPPASSLEAYKQRIKVMLLDKTKCETTWATRGKMGTRRIARVVMPQVGDGQWNNTVFQRKTEGLDINSAVTLIVDRSSSCGMNDPQKQITECAYHVADMLQSLGVPVRVVCYGSSQKTVKDFDEKLSKPVLYGTMRGCTHSGCTPIDQASVDAIAALLVRPEPNKVVINMTDGDYSHHTIAELLAKAQGLVKYATVFIGPDAAQSYESAQKHLDKLYDACASVNNPKDLGPVLVNLASTLIINSNH